MKEFRNLQFHSKVPDGHPGPVCGYGLQPSILSPRTHIQVNLLSVNGVHCAQDIFYHFLSGTSLPYHGCGVSTKSLIEGTK